MGSAKKILFLNHNFENFGTFWRCFFLAKYLCRLNNRVTMVCASRKDFDLTIRRKKICPNFELITLPRVRFHPYHTGHIARGLVNSLIAVLDSYDILHSFAVAQPSTALPVVAGRIAGKRNIVIDWDDAWAQGLGRFHPPVVRQAIGFLENNIPRLAKKITVVSQYLEQQALALGREKEDVCRIPNGADIERIRPMDRGEARRRCGIGSAEEIILSLGHNYLETFGLLMEMFSSLAGKRPNVKLYLVGDPGKKNRQLLSRRSGDLRERIVFTGEQPAEKVPFFLASADILLLPMTDSVIERARFPIRLGDYLAAGRPVVSNAVGEVKAVLERYQCGLACGPQDGAGFCSQVLRLLEDARLREELGIRARQAAENCSWESIAGKLNGFYEGLSG